MLRIRSSQVGELELACSLVTRVGKFECNQNIEHGGAKSLLFFPSPGLFDRERSAGGSRHGLESNRGD